MTNPLGLGELLHGLLEVAEGPLHKALVVLEMVQQNIPQRLLCQHFGVAQDDYAILGPGQRYVEAPGVTEETNSLQKVCIHRSADGTQRDAQKARHQNIANRQATQTDRSMQGDTARHSQKGRSTTQHNAGDNLQSYICRNTTKVRSEQS